MDEARAAILDGKVAEVVGASTAIVPPAEFADDSGHKWTEHVMNMLAQDRPEDIEPSFRPSHDHRNFWPSPSDDGPRMDIDKHYTQLRFNGKQMSKLNANAILHWSVRCPTPALAQPKKTSGEDTPALAQQKRKRGEDDDDQGAPADKRRRDEEYQDALAKVTQHRDKFRGYAAAMAYNIVVQDRLLYEQEQRTGLNVLRDVLVTGSPRVEARVDMFSEGDVRACISRLPENMFQRVLLDLGQEVNDARKRYKGLRSVLQAVQDVGAARINSDVRRIQAIDAFGDQLPNMWTLVSRNCSWLRKRRETFHECAKANGCTDDDAIARAFQRTPEKMTPTNRYNVSYFCLTDISRQGGIDLDHIVSFPLANADRNASWWADHTKWERGGSVSGASAHVNQFSEDDMTVCALPRARDAEGNEQFYDLLVGPLVHIQGDVYIPGYYPNALSNPQIAYLQFMAEAHAFPTKKKKMGLDGVADPFMRVTQTTPVKVRAFNRDYEFGPYGEPALSNFVQMEQPHRVMSRARHVVNVCAPLLEMLRIHKHMWSEKTHNKLANMQDATPQQKAIASWIVTTKCGSRRMEAAQQVEAPNAELTDEETGMIEFYKFWASLSPFMAETVCRRILPFLRPIHAADYAARFACGKAWDTSDRDEMFTGILNLAHPQGPDADFGLKENGKWTEDNVKELFRTTWIGGVPNTLEIEERDTVYKSTISIPRVNPPRANMEPLDFGNALVTLNDLGMLKD